MIIQNTSLTQAMQPETRASGAIAARAEAKPVAPVSASVSAAPAPQPSTEELKTAVAVMNQAMKQSNLNLEFSVDSDSQRTVVRMVDTSTGELIRQYPSETTLEISRDIGRFQQGLLLTQKA